MKNISIGLLAVAIIFSSSCSKQKRTETSPSTTKNGVNVSSLKRDSAHPHDISIDSANLLLSSYRQSYGSATITHDETMDANELRVYLNDNPSITVLHHMPAHTVEYANAHFGQPSNGDHLTQIIFGTDGNNNIVLNSSNQIFEHMGDMCNSCKCCATFLNPDGSIKY